MADDPQPSDAATLVGMIALRAAETPDRSALVFLDDGERPRAPLTCADLGAAVAGVAALLGDRAPAGSRALLAYEAGTDFAVAFLAALAAGLEPVPVAVPQGARGGEALGRIAADSGARLFLTAGDAAKRLPALDRPWLSTDRDDLPAADLPSPRSGGGYLQYTSGTTAAPRGVRIPETAVMEQLRIYRDRGEMDSAGVTYVSWLPHSHDFGLVGMILSALHTGRPLLFMSPRAFLRRPLRWLRAIAGTQAAVTGAPAFAYDLCVRHRAEAEASGLDLSPLRIAALGGDTIPPSVLARFETAFAPLGFRPGAWLPAYGLAEAVLSVTGRRGALVRRFDPASIARGAPQESPTGLCLASSGRAAAEQRLGIVDPDRRMPLPEARIGEIWVAGASRAAGYVGHARQNRDTFAARIAGDDGTRWLRTGDMGFLLDGELFVTGRRKDTIVVRGRTHFPEVIEPAIAAAHPDFAACATAVGQTGQPDSRLVVLQEIPQAAPASADHFAAVRRAMSQPHGLAPDEIHLCRAGSLPRSASGKIARAACLKDLASGALEPLASDILPADAPDPAAVGRAEPALVALARELLPGREITPETDLVEAGLDSLAAETLLGRLQDLTGRSLPAEALYDRPRIASLLRRAMAEAPGQPALAPDAPGVSNLQTVLELVGEIPAEALAAALRRVAGRRAAGALPVRLRRATTDAASLGAWLAADRSCPVMPSMPVPWRATLVRTPESRFLVLVADGRALDATSLQGLVTELAAEVAGHPPDLTGRQPVPMVPAAARPALPDWRPDEAAPPAGLACGHLRTPGLGARLRSALEALAARNSVSLFEVVLAGHVLALARFSSARAFSVGVCGPDHAGGSAGAFGRCLSLSATCGDSGPDLGRHLRCVADAWRSATEGDGGDHDWPFRHTAAIGFRRISPMAGSFRPRPDLEAGSLRFMPFGLWLDLSDDGDRISLDVFHNRDLFDPRWVRRFALGCLRLLSAMGGGVTDIRSLPVLGAAAVRRLLPPATRGTGTATLPDLLSRRARDWPDAPAVACDAEALSARDLDARTGAVAAALAGAGAGPSGTVGLIGERSCTWVAGLLGILRSGACAVPLDPDLPRPLLAEACRRAGLTHLLAAAGFESVAGPASGAAPLSLDAAIRTAPAGGGPIPAAPDAPACMVLSAGARGTVGATLFTHRTLMEQLEAKAAALGLGPGDRVAQTVPPSDPGLMWQIFAPLLAGGATRIVPASESRLTARLLARAEADGVTILSLSPAMLEEAVCGEGPLPRLAGLRVLVSSGAALPADLCRRWISRYPRVAILNAFGTAGHGDLAQHRIDWPPAPGIARMPIGRALPGLRLCILDPDGAPVPEGTVGALCVDRPPAGPGPAEGVTVAGPAGLAGLRMFPTGDLARLLPDGSFDCLGRADAQIARDGRRIEPAAIEAVLRDYSPVLAAHVGLRADPAGRDRLVAHVVRRPDMPCEEGRLRAFALGRLARRDLPSAFVFVDALPRTVAGRIDSAALPDPAAPSEMPSPGLEQSLAAIWAEVIGRPDIGRNDDFFALGGRAIDATQVAHLAELRMGLRLPEDQILRTPVLAGLAAALRDAMAGASGVPS